VTAFDIGCQLIVLHDNARELRLAGRDVPGTLLSAIGEVTREWDEARARDLDARRAAA
jgi:hypothetical protein